MQFQGDAACVHPERSWEVHPLLLVDSPEGTAFTVLHVHQTLLSPIPHPFVAPLLCRSILPPIDRLRHQSTSASISFHSLDLCVAVSNISLGVVCVYSGLVSMMTFVLKLFWFPFARVGGCEFQSQRDRFSVPTLAVEPVGDSLLSSF